MKLLSFARSDTLVGTVGISVFKAYPLKSWCSVKYPLLFNSVSVIYSLGTLVKYPLSFSNWLTLVGISCISAFFFNSSLVANTLK